MSQDDIPHVAAALHTSMPISPSYILSRSGNYIKLMLKACKNYIKCSDTIDKKPQLFYNIAGFKWRYNGMEA